VRIVSMTTTHADQLVIWVLVAGSIAVWVAAVVALWRTRVGGGLPENQVRELLQELIEDFGEVAALGSGYPQWFLNPGRRERELRLASLHAHLADDGLREQVAVCRAAYLACWALSSARSPASGEADLSEAAQRGSAAAASALGKISAV
jgi:hypothetical protein